MPTSQNARFSGEAAPDDEFDHPPGVAIARTLKAELARRGWEVSDIDNWRDGGWLMTCCARGRSLELVVAQTAVESEWFLQIAPTYVPGFLGWLFNKRASATAEAIVDLAHDTFSVLSTHGGFACFMWCWDGYPEAGNSTPEPVPAQNRH
jgi:hypothetical protein